MLVSEYEALIAELRNIQACQIAPATTGEAANAIETLISAKIENQATISAQEAEIAAQCHINSAGGEREYILQGKVAILERKLLALTQGVAEALEVIQAQKTWIYAVPQDVVLPAMPGLDRDWADDVETTLKNLGSAE